MKPRHIEVASVIVAAAAARLAAIAVWGAHIASPPHSALESMCYLPTGVTIVAVLAGGYWAALGAGLGTLAWTRIAEGAITFAHFEASMVVVASAIAALALFEFLSGRSRRAGWRTPTILEIVAFFCVYALVNATVVLVVLALPPAEGLVTKRLFATLVTGDVLGAAAILVALNALASGYIALRTLLADRT